MFAWFKIREIEHDQQFSVTGVLAAFVVFSLGALSVLGDPTSAAAGGVAAAVVLAAREALHGWLTRLTWKELRSALLLLAMTIVVLPVLPDRTIDAWASINPRQIWIFMILTAAVIITAARSHRGQARRTVARRSRRRTDRLDRIIDRGDDHIRPPRRPDGFGPACSQAAHSLGGMVSILRVTGHRCDRSAAAHPGDRPFLHSPPPWCSVLADLLPPAARTKWEGWRA